MKSSEGDVRSVVLVSDPDLKLVDKKRYIRILSPVMKL